MKWLIIAAVTMSLVGSMMWVMPSKRQRQQADLRTRARSLGFQVQLSRITAPRAEGESEAEHYNTAGYRLLRIGENGKKVQTEPWHIFRVRSVRNEGLPEGWSWSVGERLLSEGQLDILRDMLSQLPQGISSVESTPLYVTLYWDERGEESDLEQLKVQLQRLLDNVF
ncbi:hypothetical protein [Marinobacterium jannaschii]|uniref:hypothetical protein n=1 Tax=Marinobacterium jannaschii TaxID=64970 RepID=UPI0004895244|nr:hypothetical protein [Marinobacterium jannaschii]